MEYFSIPERIPLFYTNSLDLLNNNIVISNFLGGEVKVCHSIQNKDYYAWYGDKAIYYRQNLMKISIGEVILIEQLEFHKNWNWLMPVVEKIESLNYSVHIFGNNCRILGFKEDSDSILFNGETKIEATCKCILSFINSYNKIK